MNILLLRLFTRLLPSLSPILSAILCAGLLLGAPAQAQPGPPPREAAQFDFLVGQWELEVTPKVSSLASLVHGAPRLVGTWKAWRAFDGYGIEDELRIVDASGNPMSLTHGLRAYDAKNRRWTSTLLDVYRARVSQSQGQWQAGEGGSGHLLLTGSGTSPEGQPTQTRTRFYEIGPDRFRMRQDRSSDNGATWEEGVLQIAARRSAAKAPR